MMLALILAQLVLPWPGLDSPLVQPPGMICLGACAGPVVWGPAERGRLVVACDMRSDTCSDGRRITTVRATPVPCEVSPGVWEMVPANQGCYSVRGLESWAANTSYLAYGSQLNNPVWQGVAGGTVEVLPDGYRIHPAPGSANSGVLQRNLAPVSPGGETRTFACLVRTHRPAYIRYWFSGLISASFPVVDTGGRWEVLSATRALPDTAVPSAVIGNGPASEDPVPFDVAGCWVTKTDTPGRPCWGGEAPVHCDADLHTISTEGWPTESGEIRVGVRLEGDAPEARAIIDGGKDATFRMAILTTNAIRLSWDGLNLATVPLPWEYGRTYVLKLVFNGSTISMYRDGVFLRDFTYDRPVEWAPDVRLGTTAGTAWHLNGSIRSLTVRSYEEVSP